MMKIQLCVLLLFACSQRSWAFYNEVAELVDTTFRALSGLQEASAHKRTGLKIIDMLNPRKIDSIIGLQMRGINKAVNSQIYANTVDIMNRLAPEIDLDPTHKPLPDLVNRIEKEFQLFIRNIPQATDSVWQPFAKRVISELHNDVENIEKILYGIPGGPTGIVRLLKEKAFQEKAACGGRVFRISNILIELLRNMILAETLALVVLSFSFPVLSPLEKWSKEVANEKQHFTLGLRNHLDKANQILQLSSPGFLRSCDTTGDWVRGKDYIEMEKFMQQVVFSNNGGFMEKIAEGLANALNIERTNNCQKWAKLRNAGEPRESERNFNQKTTCQGRLADCEKYDKLTGCLAEDPAHRFEGIKYPLGFYGKNTTCPVHRRIKSLQPREDFCSCTCIESHNRISLQLMQSETNLNMVITGVRFIRQNNVLYIQPQQGKLLPRGQIDVKSLRWVPIPVAAHSEALTHDHNTFFMGDISVPFGRIVTGVGFVWSLHDKIPGFKLQVHGMRFNYELGRLIGSKQPILNPRIGLSYRKTGNQVPVGGENSVLTPRLVHEPKATSHVYIPLRRSGLEVDFGQSTIPFFHALPVTSHVPAPLAGIGLFHTGVWNAVQPRYGGLIRLRVQALNYTGYLEEFKNTISPRVQL